MTTMLFELAQSPLARDGLEAACTAIIDLLDGIAAEETTLEAILEAWPHGAAPQTAALEAVLELPHPQRAALRDAVKADIDFVDHIDDDTFRFQFSSLEEPARSAGQMLLLSMYDDVFRRGAGFDYGAERRANRTIWEQEFRTANPELETCPACAVWPLDLPVRGCTLADADHYLPKSAYPPLAVHGHNLVLTCIACNRILKGRRNPLSSGGATYGLRDIWFPYLRWGAGEVEISFDVSNRRAQQVHFTGEEEALARARRFDEVFGVLERWGTVLLSIQQTLPGELELLGVDNDPDSVRAGLKRLAEATERRLTREPRAFVKTHYYRWLCRDQSAFNALLTKLGRERPPLSPHG